MKSNSNESVLSEELSIRVSQVGKLSDAENDLRSLTMSRVAQVGHFTATIYRNYKNHVGTVQFGPTEQLGSVPSKFQGQGVGRYCMSLLIDFVQARFANYQVTGGRLSAVDAQTESAQANRDTFYRQLGFTVKTNQGHQFGAFSADTVESLTPGFNPDKIKPVSTDVIEELLFERHSVAKEKDNLMATLEEWRGRQAPWWKSGSAITIALLSGLLVVSLYS